MKISIRFLLIVLATLTFVRLSTTQMGHGNGMRPHGIGRFNPTVRPGATCDIVTKNGTKMAMDIAVVDKESGGYWLEMSMQTPQTNGNSRMQMNGPSYYKELLVRQGDDLIVQRVIMQMPDRPAMHNGNSREHGGK